MVFFFSGTTPSLGSSQIRNGHLYVVHMRASEGVDTHDCDTIRLLYEMEGVPLYSERTPLFTVRSMSHDTPMSVSSLKKVILPASSPVKFTRVFQPF